MIKNGKKQKINFALMNSYENVSINKKKSKIRCTIQFYEKKNTLCIILLCTFKSNNETRDK